MGETHAQQMPRISFLSLVLLIVEGESSSVCSVSHPSTIPLSQWPRNAQTTRHLREEETILHLCLFGNPYGRENCAFLFLFFVQVFVLSAKSLINRIRCYVSNFLPSIWYCDPHPVPLLYTVNFNEVLVHLPPLMR